MSCVTPIRFALLALLLLPAAPSAASILGTTRARGCFEAALHRDTGRDALRRCDQALQEEGLTVKDRAATLVNRGIVHMHARRFARALADYDAAIAIAPDVAEAHVNKGIALLKLGQDAAAAEILSHALELGPANPAVAHYSRAFAYESLGKVREAYEDFGRAAALAPGWPEPGEQLRRFSVVRGRTAGV
jgi:tetratricopeptide (TPR) repeat protein